MGGLLRMFMVVNSTFTISLDPFDLHGMFPGGTMLPHGPSDPYHLADGIAMIKAIGYYCGLMALSYHMMPGEHNGGEKHYG